MTPVRKLLPRAMSLPRAIEIIGSDLGKPSKMPGRSWGISASTCKRGAELVGVDDSVCSKCYAMRGHYTCPSVSGAHQRRLVGLDHPEWTIAMAYLVRVHDDRWFRWFDSGDLQSVDHLRKICEVARRTRRTHHWLPTHEPHIVGDYLEGGGVLPDNLCIRISSD